MIKPSLYHLLATTALVVALSFCGCKEPANSGKGGTDAVDTFRTPESFKDTSQGPLSESFRALERENWQKPQMVISKLGDISDKVVADIGAGTGYFSLRLAEKAKKVIAIDIDQRFLDYIEGSVREARNPRFMEIETRLTTPDKPALKDKEADIAFVVNTYHLISDREAYFSRVHDGLTENGFLFLVDFLHEELPLGPPMSEKIPMDTVVAELGRAGFRSIDVDEESLDFQYIIKAH